jgi:uncharacterized membrane protein
MAEHEPGQLSPVALALLGTFGALSRGPMNSNFVCYKSHSLFELSAGAATVLGAVYVLSLVIRALFGIVGRGQQSRYPHTSSHQQVLLGCAFKAAFMLQWYQAVKQGRCWKEGWPAISSKHTAATRVSPLCDFGQRDRNSRRSWAA